LEESHELRFDYLPLNEDEISDMERDELREYFEKHCELPPLNLQFPERFEWYLEKIK